MATVQTKVLGKMLAIAAMAAAGSTAGTALASADTSLKPGGVFLLKPGVFVADGQRCSDPANAGIRIYDGKGIHGSATHACVAKVVEKRGNRYLVDQSCIDTPAGDGPRTVARESIVVQDALTFVMGKGRKAAKFSYCPASELPSWLKPSAKTHD